MMRNFYQPQIPPAGETASLSPGESRHAERVLRLRSSDTVCLLDGRGGMAVAKIEEISTAVRSDRVVIRVISSRQLNPPTPLISLYVAPPRKKQMDLVIQAAVALGAAEIVPVRCRYGVAEPESANAMAGWREQAVAAIKQSGNPFLPALAELRQFETALRGAGAGFYGEPSVAADGCELSKDKVPRQCSLWVGPEGGFADYEKSRFREHGLLPLAAGQWTLRVELAVPVLMGVLTGARIGI